MVEKQVALRHNNSLSTHSEFLLDAQQNMDRNHTFPAYPAEPEPIKLRVEGREPEIVWLSTLDSRQNSSGISHAQQSDNMLATLTPFEAKNLMH